LQSIEIFHLRTNKALRNVYDTVMLAAEFLQVANWLWSVVKVKSVADRI